MSVVTGGSCAATLIELAAYWWKGFSKLRRCMSQFANTRRRLRTVVQEVGTSGFAVGGKANIAAPYYPRQGILARGLDIFGPSGGVG